MAFRIPRVSTSPLVTMWIFATLGLSVVAMADGGTLAGWLALRPQRVWSGEVWRLVTWIALEPGAISLAMTCAAIYVFGGELAVRWGDRRLRRFLFEVVLFAAVVTCLVALVSDRTRWMWQVGGWAVGDILVIAWARQFPMASLTYFGFFTLRGQKLIYFVVGLNLLVAIGVGPDYMAPELAACAASMFYPVSRLRL